MISTHTEIALSAVKTKRATNVSASRMLVDEAKRLRINLSEVFESALDQAIRERKQVLWLEQNQSAIKRHNERVARRGVFSDGLRRF